MTRKRRPKLAVWKFASCDGCQLSLLDCEAELLTIAGGIQGLRNFADVKEYIPLVYARPKFIEALEQSTPISAHIPVDFELQGCPINKRQLVEVVSAFLQGRTPVVSPPSVCLE